MTSLPPLLPYLVVSDGITALEFYKTAFGAVEDEPPHFAPGTQKILNARMSINGGIFMLSDDFGPQMGMPASSPLALGGSPVMLHLNIDADIDSIFNRAVSAGATVKMTLQDQFWGDRYGQLKDPFGHTWTMGQKIASLTADEVSEGAKEAFEHMK